MKSSDILLAESEGNMKTNPWMIVSLVLAFACGCMVGSKPENEAEAAKPDWAYSMSAPLGQIIALRWDRNLENPMPEMMLIPSKSYDLKNMESNLGKWNKVEMVEREVEPSEVKHLVVPLEGRPWTDEEIEIHIDLQTDLSEKQKQALRLAYRQQNHWHENPMTEEEVEELLNSVPEMQEETKQSIREMYRELREERERDN